jgi:hypothetical protein
MAKLMGLAVRRIQIQIDGELRQRAKRAFAPKIGAPNH